jgi:hypothetical protein
LVAAKAHSLVETVIHLVFHPLIVLFEKIVEFFTELVKRRPKWLSESSCSYALRRGEVKGESATLSLTGEIFK